MQILTIHEVVAANVAAIQDEGLIGADPDSLECLYKDVETGRRCSIGVALDQDTLLEVLENNLNWDNVQRLNYHNLIGFASDVDADLIGVVQVLHDVCVNRWSTGKSDSYLTTTGCRVLKILFSLPSVFWADKLREHLVPAVGAMFYDTGVLFWGGYVDFIGVFSETLCRLDRDGLCWHRVTGNDATSGGL